MDYRHTEAFARELEAAALRAQGLRREAIAEFGTGLARAVRGAVRWLVLRGRRAPQGTTPAL